jgi:hypothetical protein
LPYITVERWNEIYKIAVINQKSSCTKQRPQHGGSPAKDCLLEGEAPYLQNQINKCQ